MIAKISYETIHGDVGLGADAVEWEFFETFQDLLDWAENSPMVGSKMAKFL